MDQKTLFESPPVVQQAGPQGFTVSIAVNTLCTGRVEWGFAADRLTGRATPDHRGLVEASDRCLMIPVKFPAEAQPERPVYYRVVAQSLQYASAYDLSRGDEASTPVYELRLPHPAQQRVKIAVVNDTHGFDSTVASLAARIEWLDPDLLVWNGDVCRHFNAEDDPAAILLRPGMDTAGVALGGWASSRPLLYVPGNHDVRGVRARELRELLAPGPFEGLPYHTAMRMGPLALISLDAGEDKPDGHPVFAGTAAYEPYRERQARWLPEQLDRHDIADAPFKVAFCHIPLRGRDGDNDGTTLDGHAAYAGHGASLWLPALAKREVQAVVSGHTHEWRIDRPTDEMPITQVLGGGPRMDTATVIVIDVSPAVMSLRIETIHGETLACDTWNP